MLKRKRGRKRRRNDDMGDLDINLIQEFSKRPAFYDRSDPNFKDKEYLQRCWEDVSLALGYDVSMLKERIYQLRNRYNLEKRRLENLRLENPDATIGSPWALFNHLQFLDGHIKPRRSYKTMMKRGDNPNFIDGSSNLDRPSSTSSLMIINNPHKMNGIKIMAEHRYIQQLKERKDVQLPSTSSSTNNNFDNVANNVEVKSENDSDDNGSDDDTNMSTNNGNYMDPASYLVNGNSSDNQEITITSPPPPSSSNLLPNITNLQNIQNLQSLQNLQNQQRQIQQQSTQQVHQQQQQPVHQQQQQQQQIPQQQQSQQLQQPQSLPQQGEISVRNISQMLQHQPTQQQEQQQQPQPFVQIPKKPKRLVSRSEKYEAFGRFLSASLCDLTEDKALALVEKFTTEVVRALIDNHNKEIINGYSNHKNS